MIDTTSEMIAGYSVAAIIYVGYIVTLWRRARRFAKPSDPSLRSG